MNIPYLMPTLVSGILRSILIHRRLELSNYQDGITVSRQFYGIQ